MSTYLSKRPLGETPDMEPALLARMKSAILEHVKAGDYVAALNRYDTLSPSDRYAVLMHLKAARDRGEITNEQVEVIASGVVPMPAVIIKSWFTRNKLWVGAGVLAFAGYWYWSSKKKKRKS